MSCKTKKSPAWVVKVSLKHYYNRACSLWDVADENQTRAISAPFPLRTSSVCSFCPI